MKRGPVAVVVVGDLARSPRMVNHARELARAGREVRLIGLRERAFEPPAGVAVVPLRAWRGIGAMGLAGSALRMGLTFVHLLAVLLARRPAAILVQNPPAFPSLLAAWLAAHAAGAELLVDWHNYGYSMLALRLGPRHPVTRLAARYEGWMARRASPCLCVSQAMQADLAQRFGARAHVLYDRPLEYLPSSAEGARLIAVCPAGWTADEDMALLLDALAQTPVAEIEIHLTGDGPLRWGAEPRIAALRAAGWTICTGFLSEPEYRALLARCHFGISMHRSSSGLDLAMKVVDLLAAGAPVCALDYGAALREQVREGDNGFLFRTAGELAALLVRIQREPHVLATVRQRLREVRSDTWGGAWRRVAGPWFAEEV